MEKEPGPPWAPNDEEFFFADNEIPVFFLSATKEEQTHSRM